MHRADNDKNAQNSELLSTRNGEGFVSLSIQPIPDIDKRPEISRREGLTALGTGTNDVMFLITSLSVGMEASNVAPRQYTLPNQATQHLALHKPSSTCHHPVWRKL
jgi:hypothetical protein